MAVVGNNTAGRALPNIGFFGSQSWTPAYTLQAYVYVIGGGGSGAVSRASNLRSSGGGAGGCAISLLTLTSGTAYTITIGAGGDYEYASPGAAGNNGSNSSFAGSGISTMTANGGTGGLHASSGTIAGGAGGSATGGNICNNTGGAGGSCGDVNNIVSGGGAVGLWSTGNAGYPATSLSESAAYYGGNVSYDSDTYSITPVNPIYASRENQQSVSGIVPFPVITETYVSLKASDNGSANLSIPIQAGQTQLDRWREDRWQAPAAPFCGGHASTYNGSLSQTGGAGSVGGGGGACHTTSAAVGGAGGNGAVLIFPVDLG